MTFHFKENVFSINVYFQYFNKFFSPPSPPYHTPRWGGGGKQANSASLSLSSFPPTSPQQCV